MVKIVVWEENNEICRQLKKIREQKGWPKAGIAACRDAAGVLEQAGKNRMFRAILLIDLRLAGSQGINVARTLKREKRIKVIFLTDREMDIMDVFQANPSGFLLKPFKIKELLKLLEKAMEELEEEDNDCFIVTFKGQIYRIRARDILYFESQKRKIILHCREECQTVYGKLDEIQKQMPEYFLRCHKSYLVNMDAARQVGPYWLKLEDGRAIPVSKPKFMEVKAAYQEFD